MVVRQTVGRLEVLVVIIMMITLKGIISEFLQSPRCDANCLQYVRSSGQGAIVCKSRATHRALITCNVSCATKSHLF